VEPALEAAHLVLPLPLSTQRLQSRGFNQAVELARHLAPSKVDTELLLRVRDTPPQSSLPRHERLRSVQGAFAIEPLRVNELRDRRVVLVDDVMTSGASLHAASTALRSAGAAHITVLVFARKPPRSRTTWRALPRTAARQ
jgi:ComF family protein